MKKWLRKGTALLLVLCLAIILPATLAEEVPEGMIEPPAEEQNVTLDDAGEGSESEAISSAPETVSSDPEEAELAASSGNIPTYKMMINCEKRVNVGEKFQLVHGFYKVIAYSSSDNWTLADCDNGLITAKKVGTTKIKARFTNGQQAVLTLTIVDNTLPTKVVLKQAASMKLDIRSKLQLVAQLVPSTAKTALIWTSSADGIASVDKNGLVTPRNVGTVTITVTTARGGKKDTIKLTITDKSMPTGITLNRTGTVRLGLGEKLVLTATLEPAGAVSGIIWKSNYEGVATVRDGVVYGITPGTATITATTSRGSKKDSVKVHVIDMHAPTSIEIRATSKKNLRVGFTRTMGYTVHGQKGYSIRQNLTWTSSNPRVLKVINAKKGEFKAIAVGKAKVTVTTDNGKKASFTLRVVK